MIFIFQDMSKKCQSQFNTLIKLYQTKLSDLKLTIEQIIIDFM